MSIGQRPFKDIVVGAGYCTLSDIMRMFLMGLYCLNWAHRFVPVVGSGRTRYRCDVGTLGWWSDSSSLSVEAVASSWMLR